MSFAAIYTALILGALVLALTTEWAEADVALLTAVVLLVLGGVLTPKEAFENFSNSAVLVIAFLYIVAAGMHRTSALDPLFSRLFGGPGRLRPTLSRILFPIAAASSVINDTPLVAMLVPVAKRWSHKTGMAASKIMMPISFATLLGGTLTLIGTSNNLFISGMLEKSGEPPLGFFELTPIGVVLTLIGVSYLVLAASRLLPEHKDIALRLHEQRREFIGEMRVLEDYPQIDRTIVDAGLRHLRGAFLFQIERAGRRIAPVEPNERIQIDDRLFFTGLPETLVELQRTRGLSVVPDPEFNLLDLDSERLKLFEVVVSQSSPLIGQSVRESGFRGQYDAVILAIHRAGERIAAKIGDIVFRPGDTLLLLASRDFLPAWRHSTHFYLVSSGDEMVGKPRAQARLAIAILLGMIGLMLSERVAPVMAAAAAALALILTGCISAAEARRAVEWKVILVLGASLALGTAVARCGLAMSLGSALATLTPIAAPWVMLGLLYGVMVGLSLLINTKAAAGLLFPIAQATALQLKMSPRPFALALALAASTSFMSPIAYQTNLMVAGPGNYRFRDYLRYGAPLTAMVIVVAVALLTWFYG